MLIATCGLDDIIVTITVTCISFPSQEPERRSQLWRMTPAHQLVHVASSSSSIAGGNSMVLDIAGRLPAKGQFVPLVIQATSSLREETQTWRFSDVRQPAVGRPMCVCVCVCVCVMGGLSYL